MVLKEYSLGELLKYEQPTKYIVSSTNYDDSYQTPVLTAGKSFILGYTDETEDIYEKDNLPVIIFDDFTTSSKYVDFPFKVKSSAMKILTPNKDLVLPKYIYYRMQVIQFDHSTHKRYWIQQYSKIRIRIPDLSIQEKIVKKIEEMFSQIDVGVGEIEKAKKRLEIYREAILKEAFEGKLTETWRKENHVEFQWKRKNITELLEDDKNAIKAGPFGSSLKKECYVASGYKIYGQEQVIAGDEKYGDYYIDENKYLELISCRVKPNDVLISLVGTVGKVLVLSDKCQEGIINPRLIKVSLASDKMDPIFFKYYFESGYLRALYKEKVHGATMDVLNMGMIKELPICWCPVEEQKQVVRNIDIRMSVYNSINQTVSLALQQVSAVYRSILKDAFEGRY